jgi:hypothetical protein
LGTQIFQGRTAFAAKAPDGEGFALKRGRIHAGRPIAIRE